MENKEKQTCWECGKHMVNKKAEYKLYGVSLGMFPAQQCPKCGETYFSEEVSHLITAQAKARGLWGLGFKTTIGQAGSTLDIRLNKKLIKFMGLKKREEISVHPESRHKLVITF